ncbi:MAG: hypothetical protein J1F14_01485 [Treponema sp.]|nr:hypothetical protein [Treponema sp.]
MKNKKLKDLGKKLSHPLLFAITWRSTLFLAFSLVFFLLFYVSGNRQNFLDSTQNFILFVCTLFSILLSLISLAGLVESVALSLLNHKTRYLLFLAAYILCLVLSAAVTVILRVITFLSMGV